MVIDTTQRDRLLTYSAKERGLPDDLKKLTIRVESLEKTNQEFPCTYYKKYPEEYKMEKQALQRALIRFYSERTTAVALSPFCETGTCSLLDLYVPPNIFEKKQKRKLFFQSKFKSETQTKRSSTDDKHNSNQSEETNDALNQAGAFNEDINNAHLYAKTQVTSYRSIFKGTKNPYIFISGEPGTGKSTFCTMLSLDWCQSKDERLTLNNAVDEFSDISTLKQFDFLFLIWFDKANTKNLVGLLEEYIKNYLDIFITKPFIQEILSTERCLIIYDNLDELLPSNDTRNVRTIPHGTISSNSVILTMTRPWKIDEFTKYDPLPDQLFEIHGVNARSQINKMFALVKEGDEEVDKFWQSYYQYPSFENNPLFTAAMFCLWMDEKLPNLANITILYIHVIDLLIGRKCPLQNQSHLFEIEPPDLFENSTHWHRNYLVLKKLGKLAFESFITSNATKHDKRHCFLNIFSREFSEQEKEWTISTGILHKRNKNSLTCKSPDIYFLHKTFQEFFCAFYIVCEKKDLTLTHFCDSIDLWQIFSFLSGFKYKAINYIESILFQRDTQLFLSCPVPCFEKISDMMTERQNILLKGYKCYLETVRVGKETLVPLKTHYMCLHKENDTDVINLASQSDVLQAVFIEGTDLLTLGTDILKRHTSHMFILGISDVNIDMVSALEINVLKQLRQLKMLLLHNVSLFDTETKQPCVIDMRDCHFIETLEIIDSNVSVRICNSNIKTAVLERYDLAKNQEEHMSINSLGKLTSLKTLCLNSCDIGKNKKELEILDLKNCKDLDKLHISNTFFTLNVLAGQLTECIIKNFDLSQGNVLDSLQQSTNLKTLSFDTCIVTNNKKEKTGVFILEILKCTKLQTIIIRKSDLAVNTCSDQMSACLLEGYDLSNGNIFEVLQQSIFLKEICFEQCFFTENKSDETGFRIFDITRCSQFEYLSIKNTDIAVFISINQLTGCFLEAYDLSKGNIQEVLSRSNSLKELSLNVCSVTNRNTEKAGTSILHLEKCTELYSLCIKNSDIVAHICTKQLTRCILEGYNLSKGNIQEVILQSKYLNELVIEACSVTSSRENVTDISIFDCTRYTKLDKLALRNTDTAVNVDTNQLSFCKLEKYDLSTGNIWKVLQKSKSLKRLWVESCAWTNGNGEKIVPRCPIIDFTKCTELELLLIRNTDIAVNICTNRLFSCSLISYNISNGNILKVLQQMESLKELCINACSVTNCHAEKMDIPIFDFTKCTKLTALEIKNTKIGVKICSNHLTVCNLKGYDLSNGNVVEVLSKSKTINQLCFESCSVTSSIVKGPIHSIYDFSKCTKLECLDIRNTDIAVNIRTDQLAICRLERYNLSQENVLEVLRQSIMLCHLYIESCSLTKSNQMENEIKTLDLQKCTNLGSICLVNTEIAVNIFSFKLVSSYLEGYDLSKGNIFEVLLQVKSLKELCFESCPATKCYEKDKPIFDFIKCPQLQTIRIRNTDIAVNICTKQLIVCLLGEYDLSKGNILDVLQRSKSLENLALNACTMGNKCEEKKTVDLTKCTNLHSLEVKNTDIALNICTHQLAVCTLEKCDLSKGNILDVVQESRFLETLVLKACNMETECEEKTSIPFLNLTKCSNLSNLQIGNTEVNINTFKLTVCILERFDLSECNILDFLFQSKHLGTLGVIACNVKNTCEEKMMIPILDFTKCSSLHSLAIRNTDIAVNICTNQLSVCILENFDLSKGNIFDVLSNSKSLQKLALIACTMRNRREKKQLVDLTKCTSLHSLEIRNTDIVLNICTNQLTVCTLENFDLWKGNILDIQLQSKHLENLALISCTERNRCEKKTTIPIFDCSQCSSLQSLEIRNTDIPVNICCTNQLSVCILENFDLSKSNIFDVLSKSTSLHNLALIACTVGNRCEEKQLVDLTKCTNLHSLEIINTDIALNICTNQLTVCTLENFDLWKGNILDILLQSNYLENLILISCTKSTSVCEENMVNPINDLVKCSKPYNIGIENNYIPILDLNRCTKLNTLDIRNTDIAVNVNTDKLIFSIFENYDMSKGNILEVLQQSRSLENLGFRNCTFFNADEEKTRLPNVDFTKCLSLHILEIRKNDIALNICPNQLTACILEMTDLSKNNISEFLPHAKHLSELQLYSCLGTNNYNENNNISALDLTECTKLSILVIRKSDITVNISTDQLTICILKSYDLSKGNVLEVLQRSKSLENLALNTCSMGDKCEEKKIVDFSKCINLHNLQVKNTDIGLNIYETQLIVCTLKKLNLSKGNILDVLPQSEALEVLVLNSCTVRNKCEENATIPVYDLTKCSHLNTLEIRNTDIAVSVIMCRPDYC